MGFAASERPSLYQTLAIRLPPSTCLYAYSLRLIVAVGKIFSVSLEDRRNPKLSCAGIRRGNNMRPYCGGEKGRRSGEFRRAGHKELESRIIPQLQIDAYLNMLGGMQVE
jgi:hypothetical protein